jgi:hypothetical protein
MNIFFVVMVNRKATFHLTTKVVQRSLRLYFVYFVPFFFVSSVVIFFNHSLSAVQKKHRFTSVLFLIITYWTERFLDLELLVLFYKMFQVLLPDKILFKGIFPVLA